MRRHRRRLRGAVLSSPLDRVGMMWLTCLVPSQQWKGGGERVDSKCWQRSRDTSESDASPHLNGDSRVVAPTSCSRAVTHLSCCRQHGDGGLRTVWATQRTHSGYSEYSSSTTHRDDTQLDSALCTTSAPPVYHRHYCLHHSVVTTHTRRVSTSRH